MDATTPEVAKARELIAEYTEACNRGEEPHFPVEAWKVVRQAEEEGRKVNG